MMIRARAPLRLGLAGGGTDLAYYSDRHGGAVLNATIDLFAYAFLELLDEPRLILSATDIEKGEETPADADLPLEGALPIHRAVWRRIVRDYCDDRPFGCRITTFCDAPPGSGLGSSSTLVVSIIKAFVEMLGLPLGEYDIASLAYQIERVDVGLDGGKQDQYAATFGGVNFMEFYEADRVIVNPLRIKNWILAELETSMVLFYTGVSRSSAEIIAQQNANLAGKNESSVEAMHALKQDAFAMKECVLKGDIDGFAATLNRSWEAKLKTASSISNENIERVFEGAFSAGAKAGKISGAGGGGFMMLVVDPARRVDVVRRLRREEGQILTCHFTRRGTEGWRIE
jgi:D-glycero-alpha-D-manno-heptose-7-phosphate kinase